MLNGFEALSTGDFLNIIQKVDVELSPGKLKYEITFNIQEKI